MATSMFQPARPRRAFDEIIAQVREMVRSGQLRPGDRLPAERELAGQFAVSRNTVREALRMLEISGLIRLRRGATGGAFIAEADPARVASSLVDMIELGQFSLSDLTEARGWIESIVVRVACERADEEMLRRLDANVDEAARLRSLGDWEKHVAVNIEFHNLLTEATANPVMIAIMRSLMSVLQEVVLAVGPIHGDVIIRSRRRLMKLLWARDAEGAVEEMQRHLQRLQRLWLSADYSGARSLSS